MEDLKIVYLAPDALKPYGKNARKHGERDVDAICASIRENGFCDPIGIWGPENLIVEGHGRQIAALRLGLDAVPCIRLDHLSDEQRREYALAHNKTAELSAWDFDVLEEEIADLAADFDMTALGFEEAPKLFDAMGDSFGIAGESVEHGSVTLTFDTPEEAEEVKAFARKNGKDGICQNVLEFVRRDGDDA